MYKLFEKKSIIAYLIIVILLGIIGLQIFQSNEYQTTNSDSFLINHILRFDRLNLIACKSILLLLFLILTIAISYLCSRFSYIGKSSLIVIVLFLTNCIFALHFENNLISILELCLIVILFLFFNDTEVKNHTANFFFNLGFIFGISLFLSMKFLIFVPIMLFSINIYGKNGFSDFFRFVFGLLIPIYIFISYLYLTDSLNFIHNYINTIRHIQYDIAKGTEMIIYAGFAISLILAFPFVTTFNINTRKLYTIILSLYFILFPFNFFLSLSENKSYLTLAFIATLYFSAFTICIRNYRTKNFIVFTSILIAIVSAFFI